MNTEISASNDQMIVKGKRTKRPRASSSASSCGGGGECNYNSLLSSPTTSTSTEEDEDLVLANCLILLARGGIGPQTDKFSRRKLTEMAATPSGKGGAYVYECKTCSRSFSSFQALGGHRASHRKPKPGVDFDEKKSPAADSDKEVDEAKLSVAPPPSTQVAKIHECSICGSEFSSGQALGGHMRRHRTVPAAAVRSMLALDLNLPAPEDEDAEFPAFSSNQQHRLVFSAAALVDCHY